LLKSALREHTQRDERLVRLSTTVPKKVEDVRPAAERFTRLLGARGESCWLVTDRRPKTGALHLFGLATTRLSNAEAVAAWCGVSGAHAKGNCCDDIEGWREFRRRATTPCSTSTSRTGSRTR
jgi:hypothetical protein